jgi:hypothetical protein
MEKEISLVTDKQVVCDYCGKEAVTKCYFCGKDLCGEDSAYVYFTDSEMVRNKKITFIYEKYMCKAHLPERRDCEPRNDYASRSDKAFNAMNNG